MSLTPHYAVQNSQQTGGQRAKKVTPRSENNVEASPKKKEKGKEKEKDKSPQRPAGKSKKPNGKAVMDSLPRRGDTPATPVRAAQVFDFCHI